MEFILCLSIFSFLSFNNVSIDFGEAQSHYK